MAVVAPKLQALVTQQLQVILTEDGQDLFVLLTASSGLLTVSLACQAIQALGHFNYHPKLIIV